jgi:hypothetical protein
LKPNELNQKKKYNRTYALGVLRPIHCCYQIWVSCWVNAICYTLLRDAASALNTARQVTFSSYICVFRLYTAKCKCHFACEKMKARGGGGRGIWEVEWRASESLPELPLALLVDQYAFVTPFQFSWRMQVQMQLRRAAVDLPSAVQVPLASSYLARQVLCEVPKCEAEGSL